MAAPRDCNCLYNTLNWHIRALKAMKHYCFDTFIKAAVEIKFNQSPCASGKNLGIIVNQFPYTRSCLNFSIQKQEEVNVNSQSLRLVRILSQDLLTPSLLTTSAWCVRRTNIHSTHARCSKPFRGNNSLLWLRSISCVWTVYAAYNLWMSVHLAGYERNVTSQHHLWLYIDAQSK